MPELGSHAHCSAYSVYRRRGVFKPHSLASWNDARWDDLGMGFAHLLLIALVVLAIVALIKYVFLR